MSRMTRFEAASPRRKPANERVDPPVEYAYLPATERDFLVRLQCQALHYFIDNQAVNGLMLDRQSNHGARRQDGVCSLTATGMGFIALALASTPPYRLLSAAAARDRIARGLQTALEHLPHAHGVMPHFVDAATNAVWGHDFLSTIESAWLVTGGLTAAACLRDPALSGLADRLYERLDFRWWTAPDMADRRGLLRHGMDRHRRFLPCCWDRINGETVFMYLLAAGADDARALPGSFWTQLRHFPGEVAGLRFSNADLGLFVFQYGLDLLDARRWLAPGGMDLAADAHLATVANERACRAAASTYRTYQHFWGLSAGDGPGEAGRDTYRTYAPLSRLDGTAHLTATIASLAHHPGAVLENLHQAEHEPILKPLGRYGFSNINRDRHWVSRDVVGIDLGAAVLALDNVLAHDRVRALFHGLPCVQRGLDRLGFERRCHEGTGNYDRDQRGPLQPSAAGTQFAQA